MNKKQIMRFRYRIGKEQSKEVIATMKICERRMADLKKEHGDNIKFSKIVDASRSYCGAPHV
tara:strand:+ start:806 stop:991 length:186 start_codon:yes stop_codon:yes gene_type:complete